MMNTNEAGTSIYYVRDLAKVQGKMEKLARRATKLNLPVPSCEKVGEHQEWEVEYRNAYGDIECGWVASRDTLHDLTGAVRTVHHLVLNGASVVKLAGWTFVASIDHSLGEDAALIHRSPEVEFDVEILKTCAARGSICEHCHQSRARKQTFILQHDDGRVVQVGSSCLKDFLGHHAVSAVSEMELGALAREAMEDGFALEANKAPEQFDLVEFLAWASREIQEHGWVSRAKARDANGVVATADRTLDTLVAYHRQGRRG